MMMQTFLPNISQYASSVRNPFGLARTLGEFEVERDIYGQPRIRAGNNAAIFQIKRNDEQPLMLKCYIKASPHRQTIYSYIENSGDALFQPTQLLPKELYVYDALGRGAYQDVVVSRWIEGNTLETEIREAVRDGDSEKLKQLSSAFDNLAMELIAREWAHGDLKPENIIVTACGELKLIDLDGLYIPSLIGNTTTEIGTPAYQHPLRDERHYTKQIDDYSIAIISTSLYAISLQPQLYESYNSGDNIILQPHQILSGKSKAYDEILDLFAKNGDYLRYHLARQLQTQSPEIENLKNILSHCFRPEHKQVDHGELTLIEEEGLWGFVSDRGEVMIMPLFDSATKFREGLAVVELHNFQQVINPDGEVVISDPDYEIIKPYSSGLAAVKIGTQWGYIDKEGNIAIKPTFYNARSMREGLAAAMDFGSKKWGYIDRTGTYVITPQYDHAFGFKKGRAIVHKDEEIAIIDVEGKIIER